MVTTTMTELDQALAEVKAAKERVLKLKKAMPPTEVENYTFQTHDGGPVSLAALFGDKSDLIVIHNMGRSCPYCTLWADGFNGFVPHFENRAGFVLINKDPIDVQKEFKSGRGWRYNMVSSKDSTFNKDMGYELEDGGQWPGYSTFQKRPDGSIVRIAHDVFGPGDDYCAVWPMFDLLADGVNEWEPKYKY